MSAGRRGGKWAHFPPDHALIISKWHCQLFKVINTIYWSPERCASDSAPEPPSCWGPPTTSNEGYGSVLRCSPCKKESSGHLCTHWTHFLLALLIFCFCFFSFALFYCGSNGGINTTQAKHTPQLDYSFPYSTNRRLQPMEDIRMPTRVETHKHACMFFREGNHSLI